MFEHLWGLFVYLGGAAGLGALFAYFILLVTHERLYLKAVFFSIASWFLLADVIIPRISQTTEAPFTLATVSSAALGSALYGVVLAYAYSFLANRAKV